MIIFLFQGNVFANENQEYYRIKFEEAKNMVICANACLATYDDEVGNIFYEFLEHDGWHAEKFKKTGKIANANLFLASKYDVEKDENLYLLSFRGTDSKKDVKVDMMTGKNYFMGSTLEELIENAQKEKPKDSYPQVHKGFLAYALLSLNLDLSEDDSMETLFYEIIKNDPKAKIVLTGHSLGGAAAIVYAASLINIGVEPEKISVITFGSPPVGNESFANIYKDKINLTRIYSVLDPVPKVLQLVRSDYVQFGKSFIVRDNHKTNIIQHGIEIYSDLVGKYYYDVKDEAIENGAIDADPLVYDEGNGAIIAVCVRDSKNKNTFFNLNYKYMQKNSLEIYRKSFLRYRIIEDRENLDSIELEKIAKDMGADYLIEVHLDINRAKEKNSWFISLNQRLFNISSNSFVNIVSFNSEVATGKSFLKASAYNTFRGVREVQKLDVKWGRQSRLPLEVE